MSWDNSCFECNRGFDHINNLTAHIRARRHHRGYYCRECERMFHSENGLARHEEVVHCHPCYTCHVEFNTSQQLSEHDNMFHKFPCSHCEKIFRSNESREQHRKALHKIVCRECQIEFEEEQDFADHNLITHTFRCEECPTRAFKTISALEAHWRSPVHHLQCMKCKQRFKDERACLQHFSSPHLYQCPKCSSSFTRQLNLDKHVAAVHSLPCSWCCEIFDTAENLERHQTSDHKSQCAISQLTLEDPEKLGIHLESCVAVSDEAVFTGPEKLPACLEPLETERKRFECPICEEVSESSTAAFEHTLKKHMYRCQNCTAHFEQQIDLFDHMCQIHSRESIQSDQGLHLRCQKCGENFSGADEFFSHTINSHLLKCAKCPGHLFLSMEKIAEHYRVTHSEHASTLSPEKKPGTRETGASHSLEELSPHSEKESSFYSAQSSMKNMSSPSLELEKCDQIPGRPITGAKGFKSLFRCDECYEDFQNATELDRHSYYSPFHAKIELKCYECDTIFLNQIQLLLHINSKPHETRWILSIV